MLFTLAAPVSAGIAPSPFIVGKLDAITSSLSVIRQQINDAYTRLGVGPSPFIPFVNQLGAIDNQLNHLHDRLVDVSAAIEEQDAALDPEVNTAMSEVLHGAQAIQVNLQAISRELGGSVPEELQLILVQTAASSDSITSVFNPYNPGLSVPNGLSVRNSLSGFYALEVWWDPVENANGYLVQRSDSSTGPWTDFDTPYTETHALYEPASHEQYDFFRVRAYQDFGSIRWYSAWSDPVGGTANSDEVPSNFSVTSTSTTITVKWNPTVMTTGYQVTAKQAAIYTYALTTDTTITINGLVPDTDYYVDVRLYYDIPGTTERAWGTPTPPLYIKTKPA